MSATSTQHPEVLWAQRSSDTDESKNIIFLTINLPDIQAESLKLELTNTQISFSARAGKDSKEYDFKLNFFEEIVPEESQRKVSLRSVSLIIRKKKLNSEFWPRLVKEKERNHFLKTDFSKWVDEDEQDGVVEKVDDDYEGMGGMGGGGMGGMGGGMGGMGGMGGGMGGMGGMDIEKLMAQMGGASGGPSGGLDEEEGSDDDGPPPLENV